MFRQKRFFISALLILTLMFVAGCGTKTPAKSDNAGKEVKEAKEVTLNAVTAWPQKINMNDGFHFLNKEVNASGKGKVQIKYLGGPEVIPAMELVNAVKNGSVDIAWLPATYAVSLVPEANAFELTKYTPEQERTNGFYNLYDEIFLKKANSHYLGRGTPGLNFNLYSNFPVKTLEDFKGKPFRVTPSYKELVKSLGASPVAIDPGEVYTALERAVVVGYGWPQVGIVDWGWDAKTKYIIEPGFYQVDVLALVNKDKWNSLSEEQKEVLKTSTIAMEKAMEQHFTEVKGKERQVLTGKGLQVVELSPEDSKKYLQLAFDGVMNTVLKASPEYGTKIKEILTK
ncbi:MAG: TRAP transporter substrate-binding protein DctP [Carboxydocellales bacterium]